MSEKYAGISRYGNEAERQARILFEEYTGIKPRLEASPRLNDSLSKLYVKPYPNNYRELNNLLFWQLKLSNTVGISKWVSIFHL